MTTMTDQKSENTSPLTAIELPLMGEGVVEAVIVKWLKNVGDSIQKDEPLLEVSTDKVDTEIVATVGGYVIARYFKEGESVPVHSVMAYISENANDAAPPPPRRLLADQNQSSSQLKNDTHSLPAKHELFDSRGEDNLESRGLDHGSFSRSTPLVRNLARAYGIELSAVRGSGSSGRVMRPDLERFIEATKLHSFQSFEKSHLEYAKLQTTKVGESEYLEGVRVKRVKMSKMRELTAEHMVRSIRVSPHVTTTFEFDFQKITDHRSQNMESFARENKGAKLTFTTYIAYAAIQALKEHPAVNSSVDGNDILWKDSINLGLAVAIETGLIVPVIKNCEEKSFSEFAIACHELIHRARNKKLTASDVQGGTFSITNPGLFGSIHSKPIINQPQVAILDVGAIVRRPVVIDKADTVVVRPMAYIGLTFDHRIVDGEGGSKFLASMKKQIESDLWKLGTSE